MKQVLIVLAVVSTVLGSFDEVEVPEEQQMPVAPPNFGGQQRQGGRQGFGRPPDLGEGSAGQWSPDRRLVGPGPAQGPWGPQRPPGRPWGPGRPQGPRDRSGMGPPMFDRRPPPHPMGPPPPPFLRDVSEEARNEFLRIMTNSNSTIAEQKHEIVIWSEKYGIQVRNFELCKGFVRPNSKPFTASGAGARIYCEHD